MTTPVMRMFPDRNPPAKTEPAPVVEEVKVEAPVKAPVKETVVAKIKKKVAPKE